MIGDDWTPDDFRRRHPANTNNSGWISPRGDVFYCARFEHDAVARILARPLGWESLADVLVREERPLDATEPHLDACEWLIRRGWIRCYGNNDHTLQWATGAKHRPTDPQRHELLALGYDPDSPFVQD